MKVALKIIALIGILFVLFNIWWFQFMSPGFTAATECFNLGTTDSQASYARLVALPPGEERNQLVCSDSVKTFEALTTCLQSVGKSYPLSFVLFKSQPKFKQTIKEAVATHNQSCPAQPLTVPSF